MRAGPYRSMTGCTTSICPASAAPPTRGSHLPLPRSHRILLATRHPHHRHREEASQHRKSFSASRCPSSHVRRQCYGTAICTPIQSILSILDRCIVGNSICTQQNMHHISGIRLQSWEVERQTHCGSAVCRPDAPGQHPRGLAQA